MKRFAAIACVLFIALCNAAPQNIRFGDLALTLVGTAPPYDLQLLPFRINDITQQWNYDFDEHISSAVDPNQVLDIIGYSYAEGARVGVYNKIPLDQNPLNQLWFFNANGDLESRLAPIFIMYPFTQYGTGLSYPIMSYRSPSDQRITMDDVDTRPLSCSSTGDPHIVPFGPNPDPRLYSPGVQKPGPFELVAFGPTVVQANHQACGAGVAYCNVGTSIFQENPPGVRNDTIVIEGDTFTFNGIVQSITAPNQQLSAQLSVTRNGAGDYTVFVGSDAQVNVKQVATYQNIYIQINSGPAPTSGLCTWDGGNRKRAMSLEEFINSNRVKNLCESGFYYASVEDFNNGSPSNYNTSTGNFTTEDPLLLANATLLCAPLDSGVLVDQCAAVLAPEDFHQACMDDVIITGDYSVAATNIDGYATQCSLRSHTAINLPASGAFSVAYGEGLGEGNQGRVRLARQTNFTIEARDVHRAPVVVGGDSWKVVSTAGPSELSFAVQDRGDGKYTVVYTPTVEGEYQVSVSLRGVDAIINSPFTIIVASFATDASQSTVSGLASPVTVGEENTFTVQARTSWGANQKDADTVVAAFSPAAAPTVAPNGDGLYTVVYTLDQAANFTVNVRINGDDVAGSPFTVEALAPPAEESSSSAEDEE